MERRITVGGYYDQQQRSWVFALTTATGHNISVMGEPRQPLGEVVQSALAIAQVADPAPFAEAAA
jgi:hypothetical protein